MRINICAIAMISVSVCIACSSMKGEFGFKTFRDDTYRKWPDPLEFSSSDEVQWVYQFPLNVGERKIGVIYMKKELLWVEVESTVQKVNPMARQVYGTIKSFPDGDYKIILVDVDGENRLIEARFFSIYTDEVDEFE